jgi:hypothetical protein
MHITLFKNDLSKPNGRFVIWSSEPSFRAFFAHGFRGVTTPRFYWTIHFLGFMSAGSIWVGRK